MLVLGCRRKEILVALPLVVFHAFVLPAGSDVVISPIQERALAGCLLARFCFAGIDSHFLALLRMQSVVSKRHEREELTGSHVGDTRHTYNTCHHM